LAALKREKFTRLPVYKGNPDNIVGIMIEREFFELLVENKKNEKINLKKILRIPLFIPGTVKISNLLPQLQKSKTHMAIVLDESGGIQGIITMEDILEELVGEI